MLSRYHCHSVYSKILIIKLPLFSIFKYTAFHFHCYSSFFLSARRNESLLVHTWCQDSAYFRHQWFSIWPISVIIAGWMHLLSVLCKMGVWIFCIFYKIIGSGFSSEETCYFHVKNDPFKLMWVISISCFFFFVYNRICFLRKKKSEKRRKEQILWNFISKRFA
jgi:hypothetical protein